MHIYNARTTGYLNISHLLIYIKGINHIQKKKKVIMMQKRKKKLNKKWKNIFNKLTEVN